MKIVIFGATGMVGKYIVQKALDAGHSVRAFGRNLTAWVDEDLKNDKLETMQGHVFDEQDVLDALKDVDAVISTLGGSFDGVDRTRSLGIKNIIAQMDRLNIKRIVALGGSGVLDDGDGGYILDGEDYPDMYKPVGKEHLLAYEFLHVSDLDWTYVCSPNILDEKGSGNYVTNADTYTTPNNFEVAAGDIARFMLAELTANKYVKKRVAISRI